MQKCQTEWEIDNQTGVLTAASATASLKIQQKKKITRKENYSGVTMNF